MQTTIIDGDVRSLAPLLRQLLKHFDALGLAPSHKPVYTVNEIAVATGRTPFTIRRWIADGKLNAKRTSSGPKGRFLIPHEELARLVKDGHGENIPADLVQAASSQV